METTDSGLEDLRAPASLRRSSSSASERLKERRGPSFRDPSSSTAMRGSDAPVIVLEDDKEEEVPEKKDRKRKQLSSNSFSTQLSSKGTSFSTQGSEFIADGGNDDEDEDQVSEKGEHTSTDGGRERRVSPRGRRGEGMTLSRLVEWGVLPVNATLRLGEHEAVLLKYALSIRGKARGGEGRGQCCLSV